MAHKFFNIIVLFLTLMIGGVVIASSISSPRKGFENILLDIVLESMNGNSLNSLNYRSGTLLKAEKISTHNSLPTVEVSVLLEPNCIECPQKICTMLINQDQSNKLIVDDQSKKCHYNENKHNFNHLDNHSKRESIEVDIHDRRIKKHAAESAAAYINECRKTNVNCLWSHFDRNEIKIVNATYIPGFRPTDVVYYNLIKGTCVETKPLQHTCSYDNGPTILCRVEATNAFEFKGKIYFHTTCNGSTPIRSTWL